MYFARKLKRFVRNYTFEIAWVVIVFMMALAVLEIMNEWRSDTWPPPPEIRIWGIGD